MVMIALNKFGGELPRFGKQQLPSGAAQLARNCLLLSGELRGLHNPRLVVDLSSTIDDINRFFRIPRAVGGDLWKTFAQQNSHLVRAPLVNDQFKRWYWTEEGQPPMYNTEDRIAAGGVGNEDYLLGVPQPTNPADAGATGGSPAPPPDVTRAYAYTLVSEYGEESAPSPILDVSIETGRPDGVWTITGMDVTVPDAAQRPNFTKNLYRTISGSPSGTMYQVNALPIPLGDANYVDSSTNAQAALNRTLETFDWAPPPEGLEGLIVHPSGFLVGFVGRDIYFSEPYRPHTWPVKYVLSLAYEVQGFGIFANSLAIPTVGAPTIASGIHPATMTLADSEFAEPCLSKFGIVSMPFGVYYPGKNGLMLVNQSGVTNATKNIMTQDEWQLRYFPSLQTGARWQDYYVAFYVLDDGLMFAPSDAQSAFSTLDTHWPNQSIQTDVFDGDLYMALDKKIYIWNPPDGVPVTYQWRSKEYLTPKPVNLGAYQLNGEGAALPAAAIEDLEAYNAARLAFPLNTYNQHTYTGTGPAYNLFPDFGNNKMPLGAGPLVAGVGGVGGDFGSSSLSLKLFADSVLKYSAAVPNQDQHRLPAGYKQDKFWVELEGSVNVKSLRVAETGKELSRG